MQRLIVLPLLFSYIISYAQTASIREITMLPDQKVAKTSDTTIRFPIIVLHSQSIAKMINQQIEDAVTETPDNKSSLSKKLHNWTQEGLTDIEYEVTYNDHAMLSLTIQVQSCGVNCSIIPYYFNFNLSNGQMLHIKDLIRREMFDDFHKLVLHDKTDSLNKYKKVDLPDLKSLLIINILYHRPVIIPATLFIFYFKLLEIRSIFSWPR